MTTPFVPSDFDIPAGLETGRFRLRMRSINNVEKDYEHTEKNFGEALK